MIDPHTEDPAVKAILVFVVSMCELSVAEATGFYPASVLEPKRAAARKEFILEMIKATQDSGP